MAVTAGMPRFRLDLLAEAVEENGVHFIDVMDDTRNVTYRFYDVEFALACAMDGERDIDAIVSWAETELGFRPRTSEVRAVVATLEQLGYLGDLAAEAASSEVVAAAAASVELAPGIVAGEAMATAAPAVEDVELGHVEPSVAATSAEPPAPTEVELGAAGAAASNGNVPAEDVPLGAPGIAAAAPASDAPPSEPSEVSFALTDHVSVDVSDVKEAVRQSQIMRAVDLDEMEQQPAGAAITTTSAPEASAPPAPEPVAAEPVAAEPVAAEPASTPAAEVATPPEPLRPTPERQPRPSIARWLIGGAALAAAAFVIVLVVIPNRDAKSSQHDSTPATSNTAGSAIEERVPGPVAPTGASVPGDGAGVEADKAAADQAAADQAAADKAAADQAGADQAAADKAAADKAAADKAAADKAAADKAAADKAAADQAAAAAAAAGSASADQAAAAREAARKAARAKARAEAAAREKAMMEKLLQKQREALEARRAAAGSGSATTPAPAPTPAP